MCVPDKDQSSSLFCISSSFLFNVGIVRHFDMVNHLDIRWRPGICGLQARVRVHQPPRSSFEGLRKAGRGPGNEATHPLDSVWTVDGKARDYYLTGRTLLHRLDEVRQLLHEIGHLPYEAGQKLVSK